jgi:hypothetical protein
MTNRSASSASFQPQPQARPTSSIPDRFAHDLVGQGYMPSTPEDTALYGRVLGRHLGPVGETTPGPVARLLISSSTTARCASNPATTPEARTAIARLRNGSRHCDSSLSATAKP